MITTVHKAKIKKPNLQPLLRRQEGHSPAVLRPAETGAKAQLLRERVVPPPEALEPAVRAAERREEARHVRRGRPRVHDPGASAVIADCYILSCDGEIS